MASNSVDKGLEVPPLIRAAGGVVYRPSSKGFEVIIVGTGNPTQWRLPKGMIDPDESLADAALREVREESGAVAEIDSMLDVAHWTYEYEGKLFRKETTYYLMRYVDGDFDKHDHEYEFVQWIPLLESVVKLHFESEKAVAEKAIRLLTSSAEG
jgi:8-oxo-dGTP pyrophosphatase MutT (NUDIX family)